VGKTTLFNTTDNPRDETMGNQRLSYVYCTSDNRDQFYIGSRLCPEGKTPEEDTNYMGSYSHTDFFPTHKTILIVDERLEVCRELEGFILLDLIRDPKCVNKAVFPLTGKAIVYPTKDPAVRKKLSDIRKSTPLSKSQLSHLDGLNSGQKKDGHPRADKTLYPFFNVRTGEYLYGTVFDLCEMSGISRHEGHKAKLRFANGKYRQDTKGWVTAACSISLPHFSMDTKLEFVHGDLGVFEGTLHDLSNIVGKAQSLLESVLTGRTRYGWKLNDYSERK
jgi:hypothetical protein